ncbi:SPOR domain-containing protein [Sphingomonas sp.]|uniref:SPOR domain-containing protein n=1 Tax=Sphingomonas sp. TaxID=28214 RepID=UPI002CB1848C|nr:SPOR domain-containing protein [Sphingomonas sp.]HWK36747.1 SPOR domain-containing protein [Sphingomonas sp.]
MIDQGEREAAMKRAWLGIAGVAACLAVPAMADVKAGVDAWARGDYKKAVDEWRGPAVAGDSDAQFNLGQAYKLGRGVPVDLPMAEQWYRKAAEQGHPQAEDNYGLALFQNNKRDLALPWLEKSAARGEPRAQYVLGTMYFNGDAVQRDWVKAYALTQRASAAGLPQASSALAQMDSYISLSDRQRGTELARKYEADAQRPQLPTEIAGGTAPATATRPTRPIETAALPPSTVARDAPPMDSTSPRPQPAAPTRTRPPVPTPTPRAAPVDGGWRAQLGTFRDAGNARTLFATLQRKGAVGGLSSYFVPAGGLTRLQVGPFASNADAAKACATIKRAGSECVPVRK